MIITIDGPSGTGKSTIAKKIAEKLNFAFFDTGAMYRSIAWMVMQQQIAIDDIQGIEQLLDHFQFFIREDGGKKRYFVGTEEVTEAIRTRDVTAIVSAVSAIPAVRKKIWSIQRDLGATMDAVFEGRDMGTTVFPKAELKIFLTARPEIRAKRRFDELKAKQGDVANFTSDEILKEIVARDEADTSRTLSPLRKAEDAIEIDTSDLSVSQVVARILEAL